MNYALHRPPEADLRAFACLRNLLPRHASLKTGGIFLLCAATLHAEIAPLPTPSPIVATPPVTVIPPPMSRVPTAIPAAQSVVAPTTFEVYPDYNVGNAIADRLRNAPPKLYNFDRASLRDVLRFLADDAGIPFVALQESTAAENMLVTFTLRASPFLALETIARANGVSLFYENGVWFMRPLNEKELIGRIYKLKYNPQENVTYNGSGVQSGATTGVQNGNSTGSGIPDLNVNIQGASNVFQVKTPETVDQIKKLLGIATNGMTAQMAPEASVENFSPLQPTQKLNPAGSQLTGGSADAAKGDAGAQVIYNSDANTLYVVATRQQHQWVEGFLTAVDRPQALIGVEVKFFETTKDPTRELGINWAGTMEGGFNVTASDIQFAPQGVITAHGSVGNPRSYQVTAAAPYSAVLSVHDVSASLQAFLRDKDTTVVQYPRVLTINNREVVIRSVINQPVLASTSSVTPGVGGTTAASVSYLPIGTIINILPKVMPDGSVILNVAITVSNILRFENVQIQPGQNQPYPVAASRVYNATLQVDSGYTLAVSGLDEATDTKDKTGIPLLKDVPGIGELFKSKNRTQSKRNLIIFITPTVIQNRMASTGISTTPQSVVPVRPGQPSPPAFSLNQQLVGGVNAVDEAIAWLQYQVSYFKQVADESRTDKDSIKQLQSVIRVAEMLLEEIRGFEQASPTKLKQLSSKEEQVLNLIKQLNNVLAKSYKDLKGY